MERIQALMKRSSFFARFSRGVARAAGKPTTFGFAVLIIVVWAASGSVFKYSDTWQLVINTSTTIMTFLMVFLIQNTQNRESQAAQLKLDELIRAMKGAHTALIDLEELTDEELEMIHKRYLKLASKGRKHLREGASDMDTPSFDPRCG